MLQWNRALRSRYIREQADGSTELSHSYVSGIQTNANKYANV